MSSQQSNNQLYRGAPAANESPEYAHEIEEDEAAQAALVDGDEGDEQELNEEEIVQVIIQIGNDILRNLNVEEPIDDVAVFFSDEFYIQFFQAAFPEIDFSQLTAGQDVQEMAENIQALIDLLGEQILKYDLSHIKGEEIVNGNPEHCINLLQLVLEISVMIQNKGGVSGANASGLGQSEDHMSAGPSSQKKHHSAKHMFLEDEMDDDDHQMMIDQQEGEDEEAEVIQDRRQQQKKSPAQYEGKAASGPQQQRKMRSNSDDRGRKQQPQFEGEFDEDELEFNQNQIQHQQQYNPQHHQADVEEDDEDLEQQFMQQLSNKPQISKNQHHHLAQQDDGEEEIDEDDLKMYEQFLANNKQQEQQLLGQFGSAGQPSDHQMMIGQNISNIDAEMDEEIERDNHEGGLDDGDHEGMDGDEMDGEIDFDNIDYEQLDPQILEIAQQMGVHPKEILQQLMQMNQEDEEDDDNEENDQHQQLDPLNPYGNEVEDEEEFEDPKVKEERLRIEKELFKQQMLGGKAASDKKPSTKQENQPKLQPSQGQKQQQLLQNFEYDDEEADDDESYYTEGEIHTRIKLINKKSYSAPYIVISDCFQEPIGGVDEDDEDQLNQLPSKAYSTTVLQDLELQEQFQHDDQGHNNDSAQLLQEQQQKLQAKQDKHKKLAAHHDNNDDEEDIDVDISQKLLELQNSKRPGGGSSAKQQQQRQQHLQEDNFEGDEGEGEDDEEDQLMDLNDLNDYEKQMLMEYLQQEYDKDPDQFPFNKQLIEDYMLKQQQENRHEGGDLHEGESIKDINSQEMILEEAASNNQIMGGGQNIEDDGEIQEDDDENAEYLGDHNNQEQAAFNEQIMQQQLYLQQQQQMMLHQQQKKNLLPRKKTKKGPKSKVNQAKRPKSASKKKKQAIPMYSIPPQPQNHIPENGIQVIPEEEEDQYQASGVAAGMIPQDQLQQIIQLLQEQQIDLENVDPNILQQLLLAQQMPQQLESREVKRQVSRGSGSRGNRVTTNSGSKKRAKPLVNNKAVGSIYPLSNKSKTLQPVISIPNKKKVGIAPSIKKKTSTRRPQTGIQQRHQRLPLHQMGNNQHHFANMTPQEQAILLFQEQQQLLQQQQNQQTINEQDENEEIQDGAPSAVTQDVVAHHPVEPGDDEEDEDDNVQLKPQLNNQANGQQLNMLGLPNFSEEYLNQFSEEQLQQLLQHQQHQLMMQQQQQLLAQQQQLRQRSSKKSNSRPKSAKVQSLTKKRPATANKDSGFQVYIQQQKKALFPATTKPASKKKKSKKGAIVHPGMVPVANSQGVLMNNYFPALEGGLTGSQEEYSGHKDQRYPKFGINNIATAETNNPNMVVQDQIDEVPPEQEEAESQENIQTALPNFYHPHSNKKMAQVDQDNADPMLIHQDSQDGHEAAPQIELSDEQLIELIQNAHNLSPDQQQQLQLILQQRMKQELVQDRAQSYQNIYQILMDNVQKAKDRLAPLGFVAPKGDDTEETDRRILRQKQEFETLYRQYQNEMKAREFKKKDEESKIERRQQRESRIQQIREKKFQEELMSHQKSLNYKRNAQQVKLCQKVYKLASELEKNKLLQEKKEYKETQEKKKVQNKLMVDAIENYYKNQIQLLKERIENERFERRVAQQAQQQALTRMKRELNDQKKREVDRYLQLLRQEDQRYEFESSNVGRIENEIVKMYKKGK